MRSVVLAGEALGHDSRSLAEEERRVPAAAAEERGEQCRVQGEGHRR